MEPNFKIEATPVSLRVWVASHVYEFDVEGVYYYGQVKYDHDEEASYRVFNGSQDISESPLGLALIDYMKNGTKGV